MADINIINFSEQPVRGDNLFSLINKSGDNVSPGERGLLLYKGGTVCNNDFSNYSANAICSEMGYTRAISWSSGYPRDYLIEGFDVKLEAVKCTSNDWGSCDYSTSPYYCLPDHHVLLTCAGGSIFPLILRGTL